MTPSLSNRPISHFTARMRRTASSSRRPSTAGPTLPGDRVATGATETVVSGIRRGGHATRTLVVDAQNRLYVSIGSASNVDAPDESGHAARDARADPPLRPGDRSPPAVTPSATARCSPPACATRSASRIDSKGRLWGVENGRDNLMLGGERHPLRQPRRGGEPVRHQRRPGRDYGYPFCWSEGIWMGTAMAKGPRDAAPGSRSAAARSPRRGARTDQRRRAARVRAGRAPARRSTSSSTTAAASAGGRARATCSSTVARLVEPRDLARSVASSSG